MVIMKDYLTIAITFAVALYCLFVLGMIASIPVGIDAQDRAPDLRQWETPRTPDGRPALQGNWTHQSLTPIQRRAGQEPTYSQEEVAALEQGYVDRIIRGSEPSDPDRPLTQIQSSIPAADSYNNVYFETGARVAVVNGEPRTSLITYPLDGRIPARSPEGQRRRDERRDFRSQFGQYDHPELRPHAER